MASARAKPQGSPAHQQRPTCPGAGTGLSRSAVLDAGRSTLADPPDMGRATAPIYVRATAEPRKERPSETPKRSAQIHSCTHPRRVEIGRAPLVELSRFHYAATHSCLVRPCAEDARVPQRAAIPPGGPPTCFLLAFMGARYAVELALASRARSSRSMISRLPSSSSWTPSRTNPYRS